MVPGMAQTVFFVYPYMYKAMYGRFLLLQLSNGSGIVMLNFVVCMLDLIGRLASRNADMMLLRLMYGRRTAQVCSGHSLIQSDLSQAAAHMVTISTLRGFSDVLDMVDRFLALKCWQ